MLSPFEWACYACPNGLPRRPIWRVEARFARCWHFLALFLRTFSFLRLPGPLRLSLPRLRKSDHPRRRAFFLQLVWRHHPYFGRDTRRADRSAALRRLFLLATGNRRFCLFLLLVL